VLAGLYYDLEYGRILPQGGRTGLSAPIPPVFPLLSLAHWLTAAFIPMLR
jgi:hypothetical protein